MRMKLNAQSGEFMVDTAVRLVVGAAVLVLVISVFGVIFKANKLAAMAGELTRYVEVEGRVNAGGLDAELNRLKAAAGFTNVTVTIDSPTAFDADRKIHFGDSFTVTLNTTADMGIGGILTAPIPLHTSVVGRSEKYWK